jgi:hypothetical protein
MFYLSAQIISYDKKYDWDDRRKKENADKFNESDSYYLFYL